MPARPSAAAPGAAAQPIILALNAGSSSVKAACFGASAALPLRLTAQIDGMGGRPALTLRGPDGSRLPAPPIPEGSADHAGLIAFVLAEIVEPAFGAPAGIGHRVVHGGTRFRDPARITPAVVEGIAALAPLARSHQPHNLAGIAAAAALWPDAPQVACFDTAFHASIDETESTFAIPRRLRAEGVRRYGFHGLSYEAVARQLPDRLGDRAGEPLVVAHLGNGASICGMVGLKSRTTTMGFTPLDGLVMGRRPGRLDAGILLYLMAEKGMDAASIDRLLNTECGLHGLSDGTSDMRDLLASSDPAARFAVDVFVARLVAEIGAATATIGGLSALVFTGGIGENAVAIRARTVARLGWLGARLDPARNAAGGPDIDAPGSVVRLLVLRTDEERTIARAVLDAISPGQDGTGESTLARSPRLP